jgi:hypothetical protein
MPFELNVSYESQCLQQKVTGCYGKSLVVMESKWLLWKSIVAMASQWLPWKGTGCYGNVMVDMASFSFGYCTF